MNVVWRLSSSGGVQTVVRALLQSADPLRFEQHLVSLRPELDEDELDLLPAHIRVRWLGYTGEISWRQRIAAQVEVGLIVRRLRPEVVHTHTGTVWLSLLARVMWRRAAFLIEVHDAPGRERHSTATERLEGGLARFGGYQTLTHSSSVRDDVIARWHPPARHLTLFPLGIDTSRFVISSRPAPESRPTVLYVARLVPTKNIPLLIEAAELLQKRLGDHAPLVRIVAGGVEHDRLERALDERGLRDVVDLAGLRAGPALVDAYAGADVFCSTSDYEGFGLLLVEAMAAGLPVVATAVGGVVDVVVDGVTGMLVPRGDAVALADALSAVLTDPDLARGWGKRGGFVPSSSSMCARW